jgi:AraC family transcriptional regulator
MQLMDRWYSPDSRLPPHRHAQANLCLVLAGGFDEAFVGGARRCGPATLLYRSAREIHTQLFHGAGAWCATIEPPTDWLPEADFPTAGTVDLRGWPAVLAFRFYAALQRPSGASPALLGAMARELCSVTARRFTVSRHRMPAWLLEARHRMDTAFTRNVRIADIAGAIGVHRVHLARSFRRAHGQAPKHYVRCLRVHAACHAILSGHGSLSRIAVDLGFSDQSHFTRVFRSILGLNPQTFRAIMFAMRERALPAFASKRTAQGAA